MQTELKVLPNKLRTLFIHTPGATAGSVQIWFRAGSSLESKQNEGIAHFLEHMFFKGTEKRPNGKIAHEVESFGGELNAFTSFDYTCYYINPPMNKLKQSVDILLDMVSNPQFLEEDLIPEREVVFEEYRRSQDNPNQSSFQEIQKKIFQKGYAHPILGSEKTIKNFSIKQLKEFRKDYYNVNNAFLVVAGDLKNRPQLEKLIATYKVPKGKETNHIPFKISNKPQVIVSKGNTRLATLSIILQSSYIQNEHGVTEDIAMTALASGETSFLHKELVLKDSLAISTSSSTLFMNKGGFHILRVVCSEENVGKVLTRLKTTLKTLIQTGLSFQEVQKVKNQYYASKVYEQESVESLAFSMGHSFAQTKDPFFESNYIEKVKEISTSEINSTLMKIFKQNFHVNILIPNQANEMTHQKNLDKFQREFLAIMKNLKQSPTISPRKCSQDHNVKLFEIKPGVELLYRFNEQVPTFTMHTYLTGGISKETTQTNGIHNILCSMLTKGTKNHPFDQLKQTLEDTSTSFHGFSGKNAYGLTMTGLSTNFKTLAPIFFESLLSPEIPTHFFLHEKITTKHILENQKEDPVKHCFNLFNDQIFGSHPYRFNMLGTESNIDSFKKEDLLKLHSNTLKNGKILVSLFGNIQLEEAKEIIHNLLDEVKPRKVKAIPRRKITPKKPKKLFLEFDREQTQIFMGIPSPVIEDDMNTVIKMISSYLSGQSSPLFTEVRDKQGLCYAAQPVHFQGYEGGYFGIYMASGHDKVARALVAIEELINGLVKNGLSKRDFNNIKQMINGQNLVNIQTNEDFANIYSVPVFQDLSIDYFSESNKKINDLTYEKFNAKLKKLFSQKWHTSIVGRKYH